MDPPFPAPSSTPPTPADDRGFYRSPQRVALLSFFAPFIYELWWLWQLFQFTRREQFPRARAFWWLLVPFYNFYVATSSWTTSKRRWRATPHRSGSARRV